MSEYSGSIEKLLKIRFVSDLSRALWLTGCRDFDVLRSNVDDNGFDLMIEAKNVIRHIQFIFTANGDETLDAKVDYRLSTKASGCIIWVEYDPDTLNITTYGWYGTYQGLGLPRIWVPERSSHNSDSIKPLTDNRRLLQKSKFTPVRSIHQLIGHLFGRSEAEERIILNQHWNHRDNNGSDKAAMFADPKFLNSLKTMSWDDSAEFAHMIDGYALADELGLGDPFSFPGLQHAKETGRWIGSAAVLWTTLFLEHRGARHSGEEPGKEELPLFDKLVSQLAEKLNNPEMW